MILFIINCSKEKARLPCLAKDMYKSKRFIDNLSATDKPNSNCLIFSGKYGLIEPTENIAPYDINLNCTSCKYKEEIKIKLKQKLNKILVQNEIEEIHTDSKDSYYEAIKQSLISLNYSGKLKSI
ncbi:hypothetical protein F3S07_23260 [Vibrio alginolyticus]|nr:MULTISPECIES: DUF6884 domain-containing protein [Vibrio]EGQ9576074.1 hypothetical protein [Vibrio alginolyticus]EGR1574597.1 hypothetical protein [Vibrio alginolyticus]EHK9062560.1 hypothetical protein [Vibrio parahaemolyticus]ELA7316102.1 hypothetical protein [Vibrio alginolyticus]ELB2734159.1 hypothetical protein [Vibrio alginolyticus]